MEETHSSTTINYGSILRKVEQDIAFLKDRIERLKLQEQPNSVVLNTYQAMLASREFVRDNLHREIEQDIAQQGTK